MFLALKTDGDIRHRRPPRSASGSGLAAAVVAVAFLVWTQVDRRRRSARPSLFALAALALLGGLVAGDPRARGLGLPRHLRRHRARAWPGCSSALFPDVMPSTLAAAYSLTTTNAPPPTTR